MKKVIFAVLLSCCVASAEELYVGAGAGLSIVPDGTVTLSVEESGINVSTGLDMEYDSTFCYGALIGIDFENGYQAQVEISSQEVDGQVKADPTGKMDLSLMTLGFSGIKKFESDNVVPFIELGVGLLDAEAETYDSDDADERTTFDDTVTYAKLGLGVEVLLSETVSIFGNYSYYLINNLEETVIVDGQDLDFELELSLHQFMIGFTKAF